MRNTDYSLQVFVMDACKYELKMYVQRIYAQANRGITQKCMYKTY